MNIFWLVLPLCIFSGCMRYIVHILENKDAYKKQKELVAYLKENNEPSFQNRKKEILPMRYKVGYYMVFVMVFFWAFIYTNLYATDFIFVKCLVVALCMLSMDYGINMYSRKTNEFIFKKETGIYKQIA